MIPIKNYRTKQNSPNKRVPSAGRVEMTNFNCSKSKIQRPSSHLEITDLINKPIINHKQVSKREKTMRDTSSNLDLLKSRHELNLNSTVSNSINSSNMNSFVGRRRQSPQPNIFGNDAKMPLKLLHYHKKKVPILQQNSSKPVIACSLNKYDHKGMGHKEKEDLLLSSIGSEDQIPANSYNYLDQDLDTLQEQYWYNAEHHYQPLSDVTNVKSSTMEAHRGSHPFYMQQFNNTHDNVSSPITFLQPNESNYGLQRGTFSPYLTIYHREKADFESDGETRYPVFPKIEPFKKP
jgi:hypothetical protein